MYREKINFTIPKPRVKNSIGKNHQDKVSIEEDLKGSGWNWAKPIMFYTKDEQKSILRLVMDAQSKEMFN